MMLLQLHALHRQLGEVIERLTPIAPTIEALVIAGVLVPPLSPKVDKASLLTARGRRGSNGRVTDPGAVEPVAAPPLAPAADHDSAPPDGALEAEQSALYVQPPVEARPKRSRKGIGGRRPNPNPPTPAELRLRRAEAQARFRERKRAAAQLAASSNGALPDAVDWDRRTASFKRGRLDEDPEISEALQLPEL